MAAKTWCECEHIAHCEKNERTPNGNPGHDYGASFAQLEAVQTWYGAFFVCKDCAEDCYGPDSVARKG